MTEKAHFLKEILLKDLLSNHEKLTTDKDFNEYHFSSLIIGDCEIFLEIMKKIAPWNQEKKAFQRIFSNCLRNLYYLENRGFRELLKWSFMNNIDINLLKFMGYISDKRLIRPNFLSILLYICPNKVKFPLLVDIFLLFIFNFHVFISVMMRFLKS